MNELDLPLSPPKHLAFRMAAACALLLTAGFLVPAHRESQRMMAASGGGDSDGPFYNESAVRTTYRYPLKVGSLAEQVSQSGLLTVTVAQSDHLTLALTEFNGFAGNRSYFAIENGTKVQKPFLGRTFEGSLANDPSSRATMLIAPTGLYGSAKSGNTVWSFQPVRNQKPAADGTVVQEVSMYRIPGGETSIASFVCVSGAKVGVVVGASTNASAVQGQASCSPAVASCASVEGTCSSRSIAATGSGAGACAGWADDSANNNATVSCQVGGKSFAAENATLDRDAMEGAECAAFMEKWADYSGDASVAVLRISPNPAESAESYAWQRGHGCAAIEPQCAAQTRIIDGQARTGTFCQYGGNT